MKFKLDGKMKLYIGLVIIVVVLVAIYPYISSVGEFSKGSNKISSKVNPILPVIPCSDTDGGLDFYVKGNMTNTTGSYIDYCINSQIVEYRCGTQDDIACFPESCSQVRYNCPYSCSNGACLYQTATYRGVLDMLNSCQILGISLDAEPETKTGNDVCRIHMTGSTCIASSQIYPKTDTDFMHVQKDCSQEFFFPAGTYEHDVQVTCCTIP